jgi:hypothetical protein
MQFAVLDASAAPSKEVLFAVAAVRKQMQEHLAPSYGFEPMPVVYYTSVADLPPAAFYPVVIVDTVPADELGDHDMLKTARVLYKSDPDWVQVLSHEIVEMSLNIGCNLWVPHPARPGYWLAKEGSDPCQRGKYQVIAEVLGESHVEEVSDFVLPAYWMAGARGPYNWLGDMPAPGAILPGGYQIVRDPNGVRTFLPDASMTLGEMASKMRSDSRAFRVMSTR